WTRHSVPTSNAVRKRDIGESSRRRGQPSLDSLRCIVPGRFVRSNEKCLFTIHFRGTFVFDFFPPFGYPLAEEMHARGESHVTHRHRHVPHLPGIDPARSTAGRGSWSGRLDAARLVAGSADGVAGKRRSSRCLVHFSLARRRTEPPRDL